MLKKFYHTVCFFFIVLIVSRTTKSHRRIGAVGSKGDARIRPGKRMPGHMGYEWRSISGLEVLRINPEKQVSRFPKFSKQMKNFFLSEDILSETPIFVEIIVAYFLIFF